MTDEVNLCDSANAHLREDHPEAEARAEARCDEHGGSLFLNPKTGKIYNDTYAECPTSVFKAASKGKVFDVMKWVSSPEGNPNGRNFCGDPLLLEAAQSGHLNLVKELVTAGADVNLAHSKGGVPILGPAGDGRVDIVEFLIGAKADVNITTGPPEDGNALLMAAVSGRTKIVQMLLAANAKIDHQDGQGCTALIQASATHHPEIVRMLLSANARTDVKDMFGKTALDIVTMEDPDFTTARLLLDHAAGRPLLLEGDHIKATGLVSRPDLNGVTGIVKEFVKERNRFAIQFREKDVEVVALKAENLSLA